MSRCRTCRAKILWVGTENGKHMPLDHQPYTGQDPRGLFVIRTGGGKVTALAVPPDAFPGEPLYRAHWSSCPHADQWRRR